MSMFVKKNLISSSNKRQQLYKIKHRKSLSYQPYSGKKNKAIETTNKDVIKILLKIGLNMFYLLYRDIGPQCVLQQMKYHYHLSMEVKLQYYFIENKVFKKEKHFIPYSRESMKEYQEIQQESQAWKNKGWRSNFKINKRLWCQIQE